MAAPFAGTVTVAEGDEVSAGATIETMKMQTSVTAPVAGTIAGVTMQRSQQVEGGDLLVTVDENRSADHGIVRRWLPPWPGRGHLSNGG